MNAMAATVSETPQAEPGSPVTNEPLVSLYYRYFDVLDVTTPELHKISQQIRYQVYCVENAYEETSHNPEGVEIDEFDEHSESAVLIHKPSGLPAGTVRLVMPRADDPGNSFALQAHCPDPIIRDRKQFPVERMAEISRFCVPKDFRRRVEDRFSTRIPNNSEPRQDEQRRVIPNMTLGLLEWMVRRSAEHGLTHLCAVMEPRLLRLLGRLGIHFSPIGNLIDFHGRRQPCMAHLATLLDRVHNERPEIWELITAGGAHQKNLGS